MKIDFANLQLQYQKYKSDIDASIQTVLNKSNYIMGEEVKQLEAELSTFTGTKHAITCSSGTDALLLALMAMAVPMLNVGDCLKVKARSVKNKSPFGPLMLSAAAW